MGSWQKISATLTAAATMVCAYAEGVSTTAKAKARDFVDNEKQFHLGFLPTEQSNPITATHELQMARAARRSRAAGAICNSCCGLFPLDLWRVSLYIKHNRKGVKEQTYWSMILQWARNC